MDNLDNKIREYVRRFNENVPVFQMPSMTTAELIAAINSSLETGKKIKCERAKPGVNF